MPRRGIRLPQAYALQKRCVGHALRKPDVTLGRPGRAAKVGFQPEQPGTRTHRVKHPFSFLDEQLPGVPGGDQRPLQRLAGGAGAPLGLLVQTVDFHHGGRFGRGRIHDGIPVVSRKLSAS